ncbi:hypothetical protein H632_c185p0 [Helicosporidium sp. ATCC 50920]|nr:hypothetical protein H632_c185p0 [Helicosporidium sp. ATCC 50920]|eukprot:KDD76550.1 hypothetical protein H632_c185p0 [Helicosporidium sp. ATCC 50920]
MRSIPKTVPCRMLYDDEGSMLYEKITRMPEYLPYRAESNLLQSHATSIAASIGAESVVIELGCGDCTKTAHLIKALMALPREGPLTFCALDVSAEALRQTRESLRACCSSVEKNSPMRLHCVQAEYVSGVEAIRRTFPDRRLTLLWLGSSAGNFSADEAPDVIRALMAAAGPRSTLLLGVDLWKSKRALQGAYDDVHGTTRQFIVNGMLHTLRALGHACQVLSPGNWDYHVDVNEIDEQVEMYVSSARRIALSTPDVVIQAKERVLMEISRKFTDASLRELATRSGLFLQAQWRSSGFAIQLLSPAVEAFEATWRSTDALMRKVADWRRRPIALRHPYCFYPAHVMAFALLKALPERRPEPLDHTFSRGIDPSVRDPQRCHGHPPVPAQWPGRQEVETYVARARDALRRGLAGAEESAACMALEHELMHQETLCYMLVQQRKQDFLARAEEAGENRSGNAQADKKTPSFLRGQDDDPYLSTSMGLSPGSLRRRFAAKPADEDVYALVPGRKVGDGEVERAARAEAKRRDCVLVSLDNPAPRQVVLGQGSISHGFIWDNELGQTEPIVVKAFKLGRLPVTVAEFHRFVVQRKVLERGCAAWRSALPLSGAAAQRALCSLQGYETAAYWSEEAYAYISSHDWKMPQTWCVDAQGDYYVASTDGVFPLEQVADCPAYVSWEEAQAYCRMTGQGARMLTEAEYEAAWEHAAAQTVERMQLQGKAALPDVQYLDSRGWEWTDTAFKGLPGFKPDPRYPEYSTDFTHGDHMVLKGASPYTPPAIQRHSFRNFYQKMYPAVAAKFRIVFDV